MSREFQLLFLSGNFCVHESHRDRVGGFQALAESKVEQLVVPNGTDSLELFLQGEK